MSNPKDYIMTAINNYNKTQLSSPSYTFVEEGYKVEAAKVIE
jgi:hypothetical protein